MRRGVLRLLRMVGCGRSSDDDQKSSRMLAKWMFSFGYPAVVTS